MDKDWLVDLLYLLTNKGVTPTLMAMSIRAEIASRKPKALNSVGGKLSIIVYDKALTDYDKAMGIK